MTPEISKLVNSSLKKPTQGLALYIEEEEFEEENRKLEKNQLIGSKKCRFSSNKLSMKEFGYLYDYDYQFAEGEEGNQNLDGEVLDEFLEEEEEEDDLDEELMFLGSFPKGKSTDSIEWSGNYKISIDIIFRYSIRRGGRNR